MRGVGEVVEDVGGIGTGELVEDVGGVRGVGVVGGWVGG